MRSDSIARLPLHRPGTRCLGRVDDLALDGDTLHNVPGVEKCGPKTAVKWLTEYGTLDNLVANADKVDDAIDKAADLADDRTGGKHTGNIDKAADAAKDFVEGLDDGKA